MVRPVLTHNEGEFKNIKQACLSEEKYFVEDKKWSDQSRSNIFKRLHY